MLTLKKVRKVDDSKWLYSTFSKVKSKLNIHSIKQDNKTCMILIKKYHISLPRHGHLDQYLGPKETIKKLLSRGAEFPF